MAEIITRVDDIDGKSKLPADAVATIVRVSDPRLPEGGFYVTIDLSNNHLKALYESEWVVKARDNGAEVRPVAKSGGSASRDSESDAPAVRRWAESDAGAAFLKEKGIKAPAERGAIRKDVLNAYDAFNALPAPAETDERDDTDADPEAAQG